MKLISNIGRLIVIVLIIIYANNNVAIKFKNKNNVTVKDTNNIKPKAPDLKNKSDGGCLQQKTKQNEVKSKLKLSKQLADAKKKCWDGRFIGDRIIDGSNAEKKTLPWMVAIFEIEDPIFKNTTFQCGGALISNKFVLTAAHCLLNDFGHRMKPEEFIVHLGTHDLSSNNYVKQKVVKTFVHPEHVKRVGHFSDIGLMKLKCRVKYSLVIHPVCIPHLTTPKLWERFSHVRSALVAGWGNTAPGSMPTNLQKGFGYIVSDSVCVRRFVKYDHSTTLCIGDREKEAKLCTGDSGSPVLPLVPLQRKDSIVFPVVIGVVSFGDSNCKGPDVLTKVESFVNWINECTLY